MTIWLYKKIGAYEYMAIWSYGDPAGDARSYAWSTMWLYGDGTILSRAKKIAAGIPAAIERVCALLII